METKDVDVVIIGAGASGLTLAYYLQKTGLSFLVLEKGHQVGLSWRSMPDHLKLVTYWQSNALIDEDEELFPFNKTHFANEFADYLQNFAEKNHLPVSLNQNVKHIEKKGTGYKVECVNRSYQARAVVHCEGYFSFPKKPHFKIGKDSPAIIHFNDFKNAQVHRQHQSVCIVGKRLSAGQVIEELIKQSTNQKIYLSKRSPIKFGAPPFIFHFFLRYLPFIELFLKIFITKKNIEVPMPHELKEILEKHVEVIEDIVLAENGEIQTTDNKTYKVDLIILTTGYEEKRIQLKNDFESVQDKNRYFLGVNNQRTFASRFLRGIKEDAPILAKLISENLFSKNKFQ